MTLAQLMILIDTEVAQQKGPTAQEAELSEWADLSPTTHSNGDGNEDKEQRDPNAAVADATVPGALVLDDDDGRLFAHARKDDG